MANLAVATVIGRILGDPEQRTLPNSGTTVTQVRVSAGRSKKNDAGEWVPDGDQLYLDAKAFDYPDAKRKLGDVLTRFAKKGDTIALTGTLLTEEWQDKNTGDKRSKTVLKINDVQLLGGKPDARPAGQDDAGESPAPRPAPPQQSKPRPQPQPVDDNSDLPF